MCQCYTIGHGDAYSSETNQKTQMTPKRQTTPRDNNIRNERDWSCDLVAPYDVGTARKLYNLKEWCMENCVRALPSDR